MGIYFNLNIWENIWAHGRALLRRTGCHFSPATAHGCIRAIQRPKQNVSYYQSGQTHLEFFEYLCAIFAQLCVIAISQRCSKNLKVAQSADIFNYNIKQESVNTIKQLSWFLNAFALYYQYSKLKNWSKLITFVQILN